MTTSLGHVNVLTKSIYLLSFDLCTRKTFKSTGSWEKAIILRFCFEKILFWYATVMVQ